MTEPSLWHWKAGGASADVAHGQRMVWAEVYGVIRAAELENLIESFGEMFPGAEIEGLAIEFTLMCVVEVSIAELLEALEPFSGIPVALVGDKVHTALDGFADGSERLGCQHGRAYGHFGGATYLGNRIDAGVFVRVPLPQ